MKLNQYTWDPEKDLIAEGAFAEVFKALDTNTQGRVVALKIYKEAVAKGTQGSSNQKKYSLEEEFRKIDGLSHTNIITYYGQSYIEHKDAMGRSSSYPLIIMEYAVHGTFSDFLKTKPAAEVIDKLIKEIIHGVAYLHSEGILHRDLKPGNILITSNRKGEPVAKITDFGISRDLLDEAETLERSMTAGVGTPHYMAPEQFFKNTFGLKGEISERTDIWAIGVIVYNAIVGLLPFGGKGGDYEQVRTAIIGQNPKLKGLKNYESLVMSSLMKKAEQRAATALDLLPMIGEPASEALQQDWDAQVADAEINPVVLGEAADDKTIAPETQLNGGKTQVTPKISPVNEPEKKWSWKTFFRWVALVLLLGFGAIVGNHRWSEHVKDLEFDSLSEEYDDLVTLASIEALETFINTEDERFGKQIFDSMAREQIKIWDDNEALKKAQQDDSLESYKAYLSRSTSKSNTSIARDSINNIENDQQAWSVAVKAKSNASYQKYLDQFPNGRYSSEAKSLLNQKKAGPPMKVNWVYTFNEGVAVVALGRKGGFAKWGLIDTKGDYLLEPTEAFNEIRSFSEGLAPFNILDSNGRAKYGFIDKTGKIIIKPTLGWSTSFHNGLSRVEKDGKYGFINKKGELVIPYLYEYGTGTGPNDGLIKVSLNDKHGYIDTTGKTVIPLEYEDSGEFENGIAKVKKGSLYGFINKKNEVVVPFQYGWNSRSSFSEGLANVKRGRKVGYINLQNNEVIPFQFESASRFREGRAPVSINGKQGYIDKTGKVVVEPNYWRAFDFNDGLALVIDMDEEKEGYIDRSGKVIIPIIYDQAHYFDDGVAVVRDFNKKWFLLDKQGKVVKAF